MRGFAVFVFGLLSVLVTPSPARAAEYSVGVCPTWAVYPYDNGNGGTSYACGQWVNGVWQDLGEMVPYDVGFLPALSIPDAQSIAAAGLVVLASVWGVGVIARLVKN